MSWRREAEYVHPDIVIPGGCFALQAQAGFGLVGGVQANQVENDFLQEGEILWSVVLAHGAGIFTKTDVEHPVKSVLHAPMASHRDGELFGGKRTRTDVVAPFEVRLLVANLSQGVDQTDRLALGPIGRASALG